MLSAGTRAAGHQQVYVRTVAGNYLSQEVREREQNKVTNLLGESQSALGGHKEAICSLFFILCNREGEKERQRGMDPLLLFELQPEGEMRKLVGQGKRADGRALLEQRGMSISRNDYTPSSASNVGGDVITIGSSLVHLGETKVACGVTLQVGVPTTLHPDRGAVEFDVSLGTLCSPRYDQRGKHDDAYELEALLDAVIHKNSMLDLEQLCIERERHAFQLNVHIVCLSHAGNLQDACLLAVVAALQATQLPEAIVQPAPGRTGADGHTVLLSREKSASLRLHSYPVPVTLAVFDGALLLDPTQEELQVAHGVIRSIVLDDGSLGYFSHVDNRGAGFKAPDLLRVVAAAQAAAVEIRKRL